MFGYHDSDRCAFDIWVPQSYDRCATENRAFSPWCYNEQAKEDAVQAILEQARLGNTNFNLEVDASLTESDLQEIQAEVQRRLNY